MSLYLGFFIALGVLAAYSFYQTFIAPKFNPLHTIAGPPVKGFMGDLSRVLECVACA